MASGDVVLLSDVAASMAQLLLFLKALGIAFIGYLVYLVANTIMALKRTKRVAALKKKIDSLDRKVTLLLKRT